MIVDRHGKPFPGPAPRRPQLRVVRNYPGGGESRLTQNWISAPRSVDNVTFNNLRRLRARSREQFASNPYIRKYVYAVRSNVVGPKGARIQVRTDNPDRNDAFEAAYSDYSRAFNFDVAGQFSRREFENLAIMNTAIDGEVFLRRRRGETFGDYNIQWQFIDPEALPVDHNRDLPNGNYIRFSVEYNTYGRPVAYHVRKKSSPSVSMDESYTQDYDRVLASQMIHIFLPEYVGQRRGIPWSATVLKTMKMIDDYVEAAIVAAECGASKVGLYMDPSGVGYGGDGEDSDGELSETLEPGTYQKLPSGIDFKTYDPSYPQGDFDPFMTRLLRGGSAGLIGADYNTLCNDLAGVSFSSIRSAVLETREMWKSLQEWFLERKTLAVYFAWQQTQSLRGGVALNGRPVPADQYPTRAQVSGLPRRWAWVDPLKDMQSSIEQIKNGLRSYSAHIRDMGDDPEEVWEELARDVAEMDRLGIPRETVEENDDTNQDD